MQIQIAKQSFKITPALKEHIEKRLRLALARFASRIGVVSVKCGVGPLNGSVHEKRCHIEISISKTISVEAADTDVFAAVNRASDQAVRGVARVLEQEFGSSASGIAKLVLPKG